MSDTEDIGRYDAIVIGAGMAGLMAGNALVKQGYRVLMLEKHAVPGGCTMNFERGDFRFEASNHVINGCGPGGMTYRQLAKVGAEDRIEFIKLDSFGRMVDESQGTEVVLAWALDEHIEMLVGRFPHEEAGIRSFYAKYGDMAATLLEATAVGAPYGRDLAARLASAGRDYAALKGRKAPEVLGEHVSDPRLIAMMLAIPSGFLGTSHHMLDAASAIMCDLVFRVNGGDAYYPKGGSGHMSQVLADLFAENGGTLLLNRGVTEIAFDHGLATGVVAKIRPGRFISAQARCIVSASDLTALVNRICPVGTFPADFVKAVNERVPGISSVILFAGLDIDVRQYGITEGEVTRSWAAEGAPSLFSEIAREGDYAKLPSAMATVYSNIDPTCCPAGKSVVATMVLAAPERFERALGRPRQRGREYKALKQDLAAQLLEKMKRALGIPDLERHVEVMELATPVTIQRYTENRGGAYVGWKYSADQAQSHFPQESPVPNLVLCGHWVAPGGGVSNVMTGGIKAAELADAYLRRSQ